MGRRKVKFPAITAPNYGASVALTAADMQKAVNKLRNIQVDNMNLFSAGIMSYYSQAFLGRLEGWTVLDVNDRPDWVRKLEKEWGIQ